MHAFPDTYSSALARPFADLADALQDFRSGARIDNVRGLLQRFVDVFSSEPMKGFLDSTVPASDFNAWLLEQNGGREFTSGSQSISWPNDRALRVALQISLCQLMATGVRDPYTVARRYFSMNSRANDMIFSRMSTDFLSHLIRDLARLAEGRKMPSVLADALRNRPSSADAQLDTLLQEACDSFRDPAPVQRQRALEKLWDAWERAKTLHGDEKKTAALALLQGASEDGEFLEILKTEAIALTHIGNNFHIRHFETNRTPLKDPKHIDYLFQRMLALLSLLLPSAV